jgi:hypothetical protein
MTRLELKTVAVRPDGCYSVLLWDGRPFAVSVERTFDQGEARHGKSVVIPNGRLRCTPDFYNRGGYATYQIHVEGHTDVLFHKGNLETHSLGCVIVGESFGQLSGKTAVLDSKGGFEEFIRLTGGVPEFYMEVTGR